MTTEPRERPPLFVEGYLDDLYRSGRRPNTAPPAQRMPDATGRTLKVETCLASARRPAGVAR